MLALTNLYYVDIRQNFLDIGAGSAAWSVITNFQAHGAAVYYQPQLSLPLAIKAPQWLGDSQFRLTVSSLPNAAFDVLTSSNLTRWDLLATITNVGGADTFTLPATNRPAGFYRLRGR